jgi:hypothetical protein
VYSNINFVTSTQTHDGVYLLLKKMEKRNPQQVPALLGTITTHPHESSRQNLDVSPDELMEPSNNLVQEEDLLVPPELDDPDEILNCK